MSNSPLRIAVGFSGGASAYAWLRENDSSFGKAYEVVAGFSSDAGAPGIARIGFSGIPVFCFDFTGWRERNNVRIGDLEAYQLYFKRIADFLSRYDVDLIMLSGFMVIVTDPLLSMFSGKILNVHPADLRVLDTAQERKYTGLDVVQRAMSAGETMTHSTVHIVTEAVDQGDIICVSEGLPVVDGRNAAEQQELMKNHCDGPAFKHAFELIVNHRYILPE